jgi:hypothetical protein
MGPRSRRSSSLTRQLVRRPASPTGRVRDSAHAFVAAPTLTVSEPQRNQAMVAAVTA